MRCLQVDAWVVDNCKTKIPPLPPNVRERDAERIGDSWLNLDGQCSRATKVIDQVTTDRHMGLRNKRPLQEVAQVFNR